MLPQQTAGLFIRLTSKQRSCEGFLEPGEEVYMKQPKCFKAKGEEDLIWNYRRGYTVSHRLVVSGTKQ